MSELLNKNTARYLLIGILLIGLIVTSVLFFRQKKTQELALKSKTLPAVPYYPVPKAFGPDSAPVKIVEYSDFECPSCRMATEVLTEFKTKYPDKIRVTFHHYPLASHRWSIYAHQAAECMHIQGKFWPYHDKLYQHQKEWAAMTEPPVTKFVDYAKECGANMDVFASCMADGTVTAGIHAERNEGTSKQVNATPTFFIGDKRYVGAKELKSRGENDIRRILGLPELAVQEESKESVQATNPVK